MELIKLGPTEEISRVTLTVVRFKIVVSDVVEKNVILFYFRTEINSQLIKS